MCDRNHVEMLMRFNFVGCANEVEAALGFKARNADPLQRPLYSQIMYSWYIKRGDYRNGMSWFPHLLGTTDGFDTQLQVLCISVRAF